MEETSQRFLASLAAFGDKTCVIVPDERDVTFKELAEEGAKIASIIGTTKRLVFIESNNSYASIVAYVGCVSSGHLVHLIDATKKYDLIDIYKPNFYIKCNNLTWEVVPINSEFIRIHPDLCILLSTSGTTGSSKMVKISNNNIISNTNSIVKYIGIGMEDTAILSLKMNYSYGLSVLNTHISVGASVVLTDLSINETRFWDIFKKYGVTSFSGVPYSFQMIDKLQVDFGEFSRLRVVTQAGGRLAPNLVRKFAEKGLRQGWKFFVMYGQTEASPRMSYLPPELAPTNPDSIGVAIPGGRLSLIDERGNEMPDGDTLPGELTYQGPNIMVGYAASSDDLASVEKIDRLCTGDIAVRLANGLFRIVGRKSRFVKPFGIRVNLDDLESQLARDGVTAALVGSDAMIVVHVETGTGAAKVDAVISQLSGTLGLPLSLFKVVERNFPLLENGKVDYRLLVNEANLSNPDKDISSGFDSVIALAKEIWIEFWRILIGTGQNRWRSVAEILGLSLGVKDLSPQDSFLSLGGDSLSYIEASICIEQYLGFVPSNWHQMTIRELEALKNQGMSIA